MAKKGGIKRWRRRIDMCMDLGRGRLLFCGDIQEMFDAAVVEEERPLPASDHSQLSVFQTSPINILE